MYMYMSPKWLQAVQGTLVTSNTEKNVCVPKCGTRRIRNARLKRQHREALKETFTILPYVSKVATHHNYYLYLHQSLFSESTKIRNINSPKGVHAAYGTLISSVNTVKFFI